MRIRLDEVDDYANDDEEVVDWKEEIKRKEMINRKKIFKQGRDRAKTNPE